MVVARVLRMSNQTTRSPLIIAHRGGMKEAPENSVSTFERAFRCGVDGVEFDVQMSRDDTLFVYHDPTLQRVGLDRALGELDRTEIERLALTEADPPQRIPQLKDALRFSDDGILMIEIKSLPEDRASGRIRDVTQRTIALAHESVAPHQLPSLYILSFDNDVLLSVHETDPSLACVLNSNNAHAIMTQPPTDDRHLEAYCAPVTTITPQFVEWAHERGKRVATWSANDEAAYDAMAAAGVDIIMTDRPQWLMSLLAKRGTR